MAENFFESMVAAQMASGGQNVITPQNVNRIMSLAAQQEAQRRLGLAAGRQAVREKMEEQKMLGVRDGTLASEGRVITAPSGARFVTDAQGNVVGSSGVPTGRTVFQEAEEGQVAGRGAGPTTTLGERIRSSFIQEMQKAAPAPRQAAAPAVAAAAVPEVTERVTETVTAPIAAPTQAEKVAPATGDKAKMQQRLSELENLFAEAAVTTPQESEEDRARKRLYQDLQQVDEALKTGKMLVDGGGDFPMEVPLSPKQRSDLAKQREDLRKRIKESGEKVSKMKASRATPLDRLTEFRSLMSALNPGQTRVPMSSGM